MMNGENVGREKVLNMKRTRILAGWRADSDEEELYDNGVRGGGGHKPRCLGVLPLLH